MCRSVLWQLLSVEGKPVFPARLTEAHEAEVQAKMSELSGQGRSQAEVAKALVPFKKALYFANLKEDVVNSTPAEIVGRLPTDTPEAFKTLLLALFAHEDRPAPPQLLSGTELGQVFQILRGPCPAMSLLEMRERERQLVAKNQELMHLLATQVGT